MRGVVVAAMGALCAVVLASAAVPPPARPLLTVWQQVQRQCRHLAREKLAPYPWPVAPVNRQHPVRGDFGDPRTMLTGVGEGAFSFHNGVDISAWPGNHVFPVVSGRVVARHGRPRRRLDRRPPPLPVRPHRAPRARRREGRRLRDPSRHRAAALEPRAPRRVPLQLRGQSARARPPHALSRRDQAGSPLRSSSSVRHGARSTPARSPAACGSSPTHSTLLPCPAPDPGASFPVAPAHVAWSLTTPGGELVAHNTAADFRYSEPPRRSFSVVYAPGTRQNFAAVDGRFHWGQPGRYLFDLTPKTIDTSRLPPGRYRITVVASDTAGNVANPHPHLRRGSRVVIDRLIGRPLHYAWLIVIVTFVTLITTAGFRATPAVLIVPLQEGIRLVARDDLARASRSGS